MEANYLESIGKQFDYYKLLAEKTFDQVPDSGLFWRANEESNSIAVIIKHLHGNMMSRWTDFLNSDGEKEWRKRDDEFGTEIVSRENLLKLWNEGWTCLFDSLAQLKPNDLSKTIYIRNQGHTVTDAINRQLAHYSYHVGQIVFIGKLILNKEWKSLSIPKNRSVEYNAEKFSKEKHNEHFTDEYLKKKD